jgi:hypothetical protein
MWRNYGAGSCRIACDMNRRRYLCLAVLLASMLPRFAHAEDLKAIDTLFQLGLLAAFAFAMFIALLTIPIRLLVRWKQLSVQERWLWVGVWAVAVVLTANVLQKGLGSL